MEPMNRRAVDCSWADAQLEDDAALVLSLPTELLSLIRNASGSQYLEAVASATLLPVCTDKLFALYRRLLPETTARWLRTARASSFTYHVNVLSSLAKILPFAPLLRPRVHELISRSQGFSNFADANTNLTGLDDEQLHVILLAFFRLFTYDLSSFKVLVHPVLLFSLFTHESFSVRYLAVQCFSQVMGVADALSQDLVAKYIGQKAIRGTWEGKSIDYRILKLLEERRWKQQDSLLKSLTPQSADISPIKQRVVAPHDLLPETANIAGVLIPRTIDGSSSPSSLVPTTTTIQSLQAIGHALLEPKSILLVGEPGSGKTSLVLEAARELNKFSSLITLHLNEQTDAKSLIGLYISSEDTGSFDWQPGVLTQAISEGRWILVEDIDKAPADVLGVIRCVLEDGELYLPSRKETLQAVDGFRIFATMRCTRRSSSSGSRSSSRAFDNTPWTTISVTMPDHSEVRDILAHKFPSLNLLIPSIMSIHQHIEMEFLSNYALKSTTARSPSLRDLLKWCQRTLARLDTSDARSGTSISEATKLDIFRDAVDCYAGHLSTESTWTVAADLIAEKMHIAPQQVQHSLKADVPKISEEKLSVTIGRSKLHKSVSRRRTQKKPGTFAFTRQACMTMGKIAAAISQSEPVLLVGETGVGKTTLVQYISGLLCQSLTVVNLSQQSEASDLLGGLKPITVRSLMIPVVDDFNDLFDETFSAKKNEKFLASIRRTVSREDWQRVLLLWKQALQMAETSLHMISDDDNPDGSNRLAKRRKLDDPKYQALRKRWTTFSSSLKQLRVQVDRAQRQLTFAYVEGRIVKAVREGGWLLMDEINLASSDTLDSIVSLLRETDHERPYLHLTEGGNTERIVAHPDFRVFAAMNPATDTGKKDLAPGIRSRFTELYVHAGDSDVHDLVNLIETYLGSLVDSDKRAAFDLASLYLAIKTLNQEHRVVDGAGDDPNFTIRSLVRCLLYVQKHAAAYGLRRAVFEGANMSFCTMLSRESECAVLSLVTQYIFSGLKNIRSFLAQAPRPPSDGVDYISFKHHLVMQGSEIPTVQPHYIRTPSVERNLLGLARATSMHRFPILLQGPTSSGKTSMVEYVAKSTGNRFVRINNHEHTDLQEYLGSYASGDDGRLEFREGVLVQALRHGHWVVLDELNLAPSDVLEALNRLLDDNRELLIPETQELVRPHPRFMLFATQNPAGLYGGRKRLSRAFRNRFLELHFDDIPQDELEVILQRRSHIAPSFCTQIVAVYKKLSIRRQSSRLFEEQNSFATLRDLFRWASRPIDDRMQLANQGFMLLGERVRDPAERQIVKDILEEVIRVKVDFSTLYDDRQIPDSVRDGTVIWTPAMRRLFVLVSKALENNEPVLLVGETGCGKTQICQTVAEAFQIRVNIYNAHINTETGDLIGSQRPTRHGHDASGELKSQLVSAIESSGQDVVVEKKSLGALLTMFEQMETSSIDQETLMSITASIARYKSLFEWVDGSLVRAMKDGQHFVLDEISLAEDSVLERLNSMLEPSRTILLAEKGVTDNLVVAAPEFQFLATMNPGGDYGKRELSAALRNRLTEIWVPPLAEAQDILPILESKMKPELRSYAKVMLDFSIWFRSTFSGTTPDTIPLRDLITWADFLQQSLRTDAMTALNHGAAMVFIDSLGANPAGVMSNAMRNIKEARTICAEKLKDLTKSPMPSLYQEKLTLSVTDDHLKVGHFQIERDVMSTGPPDLVFDAPTTLKNTMRLVRALQMKRPILLEGSPGVGKTAIVTALAQAVGKPLTRINLSDQTDLMDLFGADVPMEKEDIGKFVWSNGPLLKAMQTGGWVLLDEMNLASQSVLEGLNACLDHRQEVFIAELDRTFTCHPEFKLFAAQNPHQQGGGRKGLPKSFVNRFTVVFADPFEKEDLALICTRKFPSIEPGQIKAIIEVAAEIQVLIQSDPRLVEGGPWDFNLRDVTRWLQMLETTRSLPPQHYFGPLLSLRLRNSYQRDQAEKLCHKVFGKVNEPSLYHSLAPALFQVGTSFLQRRQSWQKTNANGQIIPPALLPYAQSVIEAVNHSWPVIITGSNPRTANTLIRHLAAIAGVMLTTVSLNPETDTMDLVGGLEQHDPHQDVLNLKGLLYNATEEQIMPNLKSDDSSALNALLQLQARCLAPGTTLQDLQTLTKELPTTFDGIGAFRTKLQQMLEHQQRGHVGFVWNDGVLVDALQEGRWLVLENANTCNPAVLDRLNSLLEPNGVLNLSEQHNSTGSPRVVKPHLNFRVFLTMDPRYGEVSRAMRNRSLELHIDEIASGHHDDKNLGYPCSSGIYRIRNAENLALSDRESEMSRLMSSICMDHLSDTDHDLLGDSALNDSTSAWPGKVLEDQLQARCRLPPAFQEHRLNLQSLLLAPVRMRPANFISYLPLPGINEPLVLLSSEISVKTNVVRYAWAHSMLLRTNAILQALDQARVRSETLHRNEQDLLDRSIARGTREHNDWLPFADFLLAASSALREAIERNYDSIDKESQRYIENVLGFAKSLLLLSRQQIIAPGIVPAYLYNGYEVVSRSPARFANAEAALCTALDLFAKDSKLMSGCSLHIMWNDLRPLTPSTHQKLLDVLRLEALLQRVDRLQIFPASLSHVAKVKRQLLDLYRFMLTSDKSESSSLDQIERQLIQQESANSHEVINLTHFAGAFQSLFQLLEASNTSTSHEVLSSLARIPTLMDYVSSEGRPLPQAFVNILQITAHGQDNESRDAWRDNFGLEMLQKVSSSYEQPISTLDQLQLETKTLLRTVSSMGANYNSCVLLERLQYQMRNIVLETLSCHKDLLITQNLDHWPQVYSASTEFEFAAALPQNHYFRTIYHDYFQTSVSWLSQPSTVESLPSLGAAFLAVSLGLLRLVVPDQPFDPALTSQVSYAQFKRRHQDISNMIAAQKSFNVKFTGQQTSFLIRVTAEEFQSLSDEPAAAKVVRPVANGLDLLMAEFTSLLRLIVDRRPEKILLSQMQGRWQDTSLSSDDVHAEAESLVQIIDQVVNRLKLVDRAFDDLTKPIMWLLRCLALGTQMLAACCSNSSRASEHVRRHAERVFWLSATPEQVVDWPLPEKELDRMDTETCLDWLDHFALGVTMRGKSLHTEPSHLQDLLKVLYRSYEIWKARLEKDQDAAVERSKYYAYRDDEDLDESEENQAIAQMFPIYDEAQPANMTASTAYQRNDAGAAAISLARLQHQVFSDEGSHGALETFLHRSVDRLSDYAAHESFELGPISSQDLVPAILLQLHQNLWAFEATDRHELLNVYTDADIVESRNLYRLIEIVLVNFRRIHAAWPEHAIPVDVISCCLEILNFNLKDPIAKLMTKTEKILDLVSQWQIVASREYSAGENIDELTKLIVRWRQLELGSWSRLLDLEQEKFEERAMSWYFMLFEAMISNPRQARDQQGDLRTYLIELARTLEDFLISTNIGEFFYRLRLCRSFEKLLLGLTKAEFTLQPVLDCVTNVINHHQRFYQVAQSTLGKGRAELEKKLREQIKLASWKDTSVTSLRESARRSHHKLFKIVRKYRLLLLQPLQTPTGSPNDHTSEEFTLASESLQTPIEAVESALRVAARTISGWALRPERLLNPFGAAARMSLLIRHPRDNFRSLNEVSTFTNSLQAAMKDLRSRTPLMLTEDNQSTVNHLKSLKQTLFSDTLRAIKIMGVRRDLGSSEMEKQSSRAVVLALVPGIASRYNVQICISANNYFHEILDLMPAVRGALTEHSDQVRVADIRRSVSYADGLLSILIQQRLSLVTCDRDVSAFGLILERLDGFAQQSASQFEHVSSDFRSRQRTLMARLSWLPEVLALTVKVLRIQWQNSEVELGRPIDLLLRYSEKIKKSLFELRNQSPLPTGICLKKEIGLTDSIYDLLKDLQREIEVEVTRCPQSATILQKLIQWTDLTTAEVEVIINGFYNSSIDELDQVMRQCLDAMFNAVQLVSEAGEQMSFSSDINRWLAKTNKQQGEMMEKLRVQVIADKLQHVEASLEHVASENLSTAISLLVTALPILEQYLLLCRYIVRQALMLHCATARMTAVLIKSLTAIASEGFCSPEETSRGEEQSGPVESGTGLGDGEGGEDISKDVGEDEDLSELAQAKNDVSEENELETSKDAVNLDKDDLNANDNGVEEHVEDTDSSSQSRDEEGSDFDEEKGSVDDLDPSAVDEKMWEGLDEEKDRELENEKAKGKPSDDQTAKQENKADGSDEQKECPESEGDSDGSDDDDAEGVGRNEMEKADPQMQEEKVLDLPDEMQLNGEEVGDQEDVSDDEIGDLSDVEDESPAGKPEEEAVENGDAEEGSAGEHAEDPATDQESREETGQAEEDEIMDEQPESEIIDYETDRDTRHDEMNYSVDEDQAGEMGEGGAVDADEMHADPAREKAANTQSDDLQQEIQDGTERKDNNKGEVEDGGRTRRGRSENTVSRQVEALKKLGDILEQWHHRREIHQATQDDTEQAADEIELADADFEHIENEDERGDAQALGTASNDQAQALDQNKAIEDNGGDRDQDPANIDEQDQPVQEKMVERFSQLQTNSDIQQDSGPGAIIPIRAQEIRDRGRSEDATGDIEDAELENDDISQDFAVSTQDAKMSLSEASKLWSHYSAKVQHISLILTEQLRLILAPTLATKLRGDFRTGKRLNIKRIIPYIASGYKRDKIWMRRSVPSKRNYQIMLALDDSKSMMEGGAGALAFETLAMLCKSLSMLEVGDLCVVGFGNEEHIRVAHPFGQPFGNEAGVNIFQNFTFNQTATDVRKMVKESIEIFQDTRAKSTGSQSELWQLQLIISDGICEDHESISRVVRQAKEEKIMVVFVIVDGSGQSILDLTQASFEPDETGEMKLSMRKYLERFPFPYYLVVRDVRDLPAVLATALKGWFAQVVDVHG